ncbi:FixH family protein [Corticicoccus populi]|uniref:FixH family protein n=1 Tax=Corticicoccus populi TaxID=1812821 RepID=A0ABW5WZI1_9STAP
MKIKSFLVMLISLLLLSACNTSDEDTHGDHADMNHDAPNEDDIRTLEVDLMVPEETVSSGEAVEISAHVTSNDEDVEDADAVMFEIIRDEESLAMIEVDHDDSGVYKIEYTFESPGDYTVIAHVDAFQLHTMPSKEVIVE